MPATKAQLAILAAFFGLAAATPQQFDFGFVQAAPTVASGPDFEGYVSQTASIITTFASPSAVLTAAPTQTIQARSINVEKRDQTINSAVTNTAYGACLGTSGSKTSLNYGSLYWLSGGCTHNINGNLDNNGTLVMSQTAQKQTSGGLNSNWIGHDPYNGNLINRVGGTIELDDITSSNSANYNWQLRSFLNNGTLQMCGRGDTGGSSFQITSDLDAVNNGLISFEQTANNQGSNFVWQNTVQSCSGTVSNVYNNGAFRMINTLLQNSQNVYGNGCWQIGQGGVFYLLSGTGLNQNPSNKPALSGQSISFLVNSGTLHMDSGVYSRNSNFGAQVFGFGPGNALEFSELVWSYSYSTTTGVLSVTMWTGNKVNIALGMGYNPKNFYWGLNPSKYFWIGYNAIFYNGAEPAQTTPAQCNINAPLCGNLASNPPAPSATGYVTTTSTATIGSPVTTITIQPSGTVSGTVEVITAFPSMWTGYQAYYPALATGLTTDPALAATATTTAGQACPTNAEAGTSCGFLNPQDPCAPQPDGYGPVPANDTPAAFLTYPAFSAMALGAPTVVPSTNGSQYVQTFANLNASSSASSYLGLTTLKSYDVAGCAALCDNKDLCTAFNIYIERDPSLKPSTPLSAGNEFTVWGTNCPNPPSMTSYKCTLWGSELDSTTATNTGETRIGFQIVITGSDGYDKTNSTIPIVNPGTPTSSTTSTTAATTTPTTMSTMTSTSSVSTTSSTSSAPTSTFTPPSNPGCYNPKPHQGCGNGAINAPTHWLGSQWFPGPYNPDMCRQYAQSQNIANVRAATQQGLSSYSTCKMFNAYYLHKNGVPAGTVCSLYDTVLDSSYATYNGGYSAAGDHFECRQSWTWSLQ